MYARKTSYWDKKKGESNQTVWQIIHDKHLYKTIKLIIHELFPELLLDGSFGAIGDDGRGVSEHKSGDPALGGGALLRSCPEHQEHVLLVAGQDLDHLALNDADLILLHSQVVLGHQHGGYATAAATFTLHQREEARS